MLSLADKHGYLAAPPRDTMRRFDWRMPLEIASWRQGESNAVDS